MESRSEKPDACPKVDTCPKVVVVLDKDMAGDWQYADAIRKVCAGCKESDGKTK